MKTMKPEMIAMLRMRNTVARSEFRPAPLGSHEATAWEANAQLS